MNPIPDQVDLLRQLMDNITDNIYFKDRDSRLILLNQADAEWLGFKHPQDAIGKSNFDLFTPEFAQAALADEQHIMKTGESLSGKIEYVTWADGHTKWISTTKIPMRDAEGSIVGCIGIGRDITPLKQKESELEEANRKLTATNEQIAEDVRIAANLQQTFLPQSYPSYLDTEGNPLIQFHYHYEADGQIGGDLCSIFRISDCEVGLFICDAMGHGVRAALITGVIKAIGDELAKSAPSPDQFLTEMNRRLFPILRTQENFIFASACYVTLNIDTLELTGAVAGHPLPVLLQRQAGVVCPLDVPDDAVGPALAIEADHCYQRISTTLGPGDALLLFTDGLFEVCDIRKDEMGIDRLLESIVSRKGQSIRELIEGVVEDARSYGDNGIFCDDVCVFGFSLAT